ncbi:ribonuclease-like protein hi large subunit [Viridothelium virens]|uniref:Ribonuclease n=1 Tax=Viridothelium virens TaxID=1048519 RepID=A0A6A6GTC4_VIRVR|nr:ribonuclease-like protein hi large subunit [Viridothelium virens]
MAEIEAQEILQDSQDFTKETIPEDVFVAPSINHREILSGCSYSHFSPLPEALGNGMNTECVIGIDEAGRGPVLGPMVYALFYLPLSLHHSLLAETHHFNDSKVLTPAVRSSLMEKLCTGNSDLFRQCGWATTVMSARDISAGRLKSVGTYNLNAQAMDATVELMKKVLDMGVNVREVYIDTIGKPEHYQSKLERIFPNLQITVATKADSLYPCVSAASVCAKVTRDAALDVSYDIYREEGVKDFKSIATDSLLAQPEWGSGYPSDARCSMWLKHRMDPIFGWGPECRFCWDTVKKMLDAKAPAAHVDWPVEVEDDSMKVTNYFSGSAAAGETESTEQDELSGWFGRRVSEPVF